MFCPKCGNKLDEFSKFCTGCGNMVPTVMKKNNVDSSIELTMKANDFVTPEVNTNESEKIADVINSIPEKQNNDTIKSDKKRKFPWVILIIVTIALLIIGTIVFIAFKTFPLDVSINKNGSTTTSTGTIDELVLKVETNQPIKCVSYALNPVKVDDMALYTEVEAEFFSFSQDLHIKELKLLPGKSKLYIKVYTWFDEFEYDINLTCTIGYVSAPNFDLITTIDGAKVVSNELIVTFEDNVPETEISRIIADVGGKIVGNIYVLNQYQVRFDDLSAYELNSRIDMLQNNANVKSANYNMFFDADLDAIPNDTEYDSWNVDEPGGNNWWLECIDAPGAWEYQDKMQTVKVGVIDSILRYDHEDITVDPTHGSFITTDDFGSLQEVVEYYKKNEDTHRCMLISEDDKCTFCNMKDHGTHVSGIIGATSQNKKGVCGVNWNADVYFANGWFFYIDDFQRLQCGSTYMGFLYQITYLVMSECRVINMSLGSSKPSEQTDTEKKTAQQYDDAIKNLEDAGYDFLISKSAGNDKSDANKYEFNRILSYGEHAKAHTIFVSAVAHMSVEQSEFNFMKTQYSLDTRYTNHGSLVEIAAPGTSVYSTYFYGYDNMDGTSMASPVVAGTASLLYSIDPGLKYSRVKEILINSIDQHCAFENRLYPIVNAKLSVEFLLNNPSKTPTVSTPKVGFVTGTVKDAVTGEKIGNARVNVTNNSTDESFVASVLETGEYYLYADPGVYTMTFASDGYITETIYNVNVDEGIVKYNVALNMVIEKDQKGYSSGRVIDAFDASSIKNAKILVYKGIDNDGDDNLVATTYSDSSGMYSLELAPGNYTLRVSADNYTSGTTNIVIVAETTKSNQDCTLTPVLKEGEVRFVLTWGEYPRDLDSHLVGPTESDTDFHTYYSNKNYYFNGTQYVNLDVDDTSSYGPETTSIYIGVSGVYTFYVHDYSNRDRTFSNELSTSEATVKVYVAGRETPYIFNVPNEDGTLWEVCTVENGKVTPKNAFSYASAAANIGQDTLR